MTRVRLPVSVIVVAAVVGGIFNPPLRAQSSGLSGGALYRLYCASCHGPLAKGDGPLASSMRITPADLTKIARRNRGSFPAEQVSRMIDGRSPKRAHGSDMPVWGDAFSTSNVDALPVDERLRRLVRYLESIQEK